ncbi:MAG TPA: cytochrome P450 [Meiothermus sp.]|nr:cytochrome P450 [Meiothermus sp.]
MAIDLRDPAFLENPYPFYARLREESPAYWLPVEDRGMWMFTRYAEVELVLKDLRFKKDIRTLRPQDNDLPQMLSTDPPDHTRLRALVSQAFTPGVVRNLEPHIRDIVNHLLERVKTQGELELMRDFAMPLPVIVIAELMGVPMEDREQFRGWSTHFALGNDAVSASKEAQERAQAAIFALGDYFRQLIAKRYQNSQNDLISSLIAARSPGQHSGGKLTPEELIGTCILLLIAGHETTVNLIGNGTRVLLEHPDQLERLRQHPELMETAVEEMLRYDAPVQRSTFRFAGERVEVAGQVIEPGQQVSAVIGSANRDPEIFSQPERFDVARTPNRHQSFGRGIHFCLGAPLARLEARVAFQGLLEAFSKLEFAGEPVRRPATMFRGLERFPIRLA